MPAKILWAWEREENLRFLNGKDFGVAFLAQTLTLENDSVDFRPRRQPLEVSPDAYLIAVTRIETAKDPRKSPALSAEQKKKIVEAVTQTLALPRVRAVQVDFDAVVTERSFYRETMADLRKELPSNTPLSMTALASWCAGDRWLEEFPVDEAVPMIFEMGAETEKVRAFLTAGKDWREPLCRSSYGLSVDEPVRFDFKGGRRFYYFKSSAWVESDLERIK